MRVGDHRRSQRSRDDREPDVQPSLLGVPERVALLGMAVDLTDGVVDIEERDPSASAPVSRFGTRLPDRPTGRR